MPRNKKGNARCIGAHPQNEFHVWIHLCVTSIVRITSGHNRAHRRDTRFIRRSASTVGRYLLHKRRRIFIVCIVDSLCVRRPHTIKTMKAKAMCAFDTDTWTHTVQRKKRVANCAKERKVKIENNKNVYIRLQRTKVFMKKKEKKRKRQQPSIRWSTKTYDAIITRSQWRLSHLHIVRFHAWNECGLRARTTWAKLTAVR